jgi:hypothetical protein
VRSTRSLSIIRAFITCHTSLFSFSITMLNHHFRNTKPYPTFTLLSRSKSPPRIDPHPDIRLFTFARTFVLRVHHEVQPLPTRVQEYRVRRRTDSVAELRRDLPVLDGCNFEQASVKAQPQPLSTCSSAAHETWACFEKNLFFHSKTHEHALCRKRENSLFHASRASIGSCWSKLHMRHAEDVTCYSLHHTF